MEHERSALGTVYDRTMRALHGIPDTTTVKPATVRTMHPVLELAQTFIVQTYRHRKNADRAEAARRKAQGILPGFMKRKQAQ